MPPAPDPTPGHRPRAPITWVVIGVTTLAVLAGAAVTFGVLRGVLGGDADVPRPAASAHLGVSQDGYAVWEVNDDGRPVRWDPCTPIEVVVAAEDGPVPADALVADVEAALDDLTEATGLRFSPVHLTDERPDADRPAAAPQPDGDGWAWAPVLVAWADPGEDDLPLRDVDRGIGVPVAVGPAGDRVYVTGQVVLNRQRDDLRSGRDDRAFSWGATVLHELAHVVGLDHVDDPSELMSTYPGQGPVVFGSGDLAGLAALGADGGCVEVPPARPVQVRTTDS